MISSAYTPEKLKELEAMDNETFQYYLGMAQCQNGQTSNGRRFANIKARRLSEKHKKASLEVRKYDEPAEGRVAQTVKDDGGWSRN